MYFRKNLTGDAEAAATHCVVHPPSSTVYAQWSKKQGKKQWNKLHCTDLAATLREVYWGEFLKQLIIRANSLLVWASGKPLALSTSRYFSSLFSSLSATSLLISSVGMFESITITSCKPVRKKTESESARWQRVRPEVAQYKPIFWVYASGCSGQTFVKTGPGTHLPRPLPLLLGWRSLYFGSMLVHLGTMLVPILFLLVFLLCFWLFLFLFSLS